MDNFLKLQRILWMSLLSSLLFMGGVAFFVLPMTGEPAPHFFLAIFIGLAIADLLAVQLLRAKLLPPTVDAASLHEDLPDADSPESRAALQQLAKTYIISWALCETVAMFGLMATMLLQQRVFYVAFAGVAAVFLVLYRPDSDDVAGALRAAARKP